MINLSEEQINKGVPYKVTRLAENSFMFQTLSGVTYSVGFVDDYMFMESGAYQFFISNTNNKPSPDDPLLRKTIAYIIKAFLDSEPSVAVYICDSSDGKQQARDKLFARWFNNYYDKTNYTLVQEHILFDGILYYGSIILKNDHPLYNSVIEKFHDFVKDLPTKF